MVNRATAFGRSQSHAERANPFTRKVILPGAAHAALLVEEPEDTALGAESMILTDRDGVASAEKRRECA
jgi:hypothetical protein